MIEIRFSWLTRIRGSVQREDGEDGVLFGVMKMF